MPLTTLTADGRQSKADYARTFRKTHPEYYKKYMKEYRKRKAEERIDKAFEILYGEKQDEI